MHLTLGLNIMSSDEKNETRALSHGFIFVAQLITQIWLFLLIVKFEYDAVYPPELFWMLYTMGVIVAFIALIMPFIFGGSFSSGDRFTIGIGGLVILVMSLLIWLEPLNIIMN
jgi:hypothetical protein